LQNFKSPALPGFFLFREIVLSSIEKNNLCNPCNPINPRSVLSNQEIRRYKKQILVPDFGEAGQEKLKKSRVIVIGAGGMGTAALQYLASAGVGEIAICDNSIIEESDFQNQLIFKSNDLGKHKSIVVKANLESFNDLNTYTIFNIFISKENAKIICSDFDLIIDTANDRKISQILDEVSSELNIPMVLSSCLQNKYTIAVLNFNKGPHLKEILFKENNHNAGANNLTSKTCFGASDGIAGSIVALEAIKILSGKGEVLSNRILSIDPINLKFEFTKF